VTDQFTGLIFLTWLFQLEPLQKRALGLQRPLIHLFKLLHPLRRVEFGSLPEQDTVRRLFRHDGSPAAHANFFAERLRQDQVALRIHRNHDAHSNVLTPPRFRRFSSRFSLLSLPHLGARFAGVADFKTQTPVVSPLAAGMPAAEMHRRERR
jgi:hypothetical protein